MKKKILLILIILLSITGIIYLKSVKQKPRELFYQKMVEFNLLKRCYVPKQDYIEIFNQEGLDYEVIDRQVTSDSLAQLLNDKIKAEDKVKIPTVTHHIYFTPSNNKTVKLNDFYLEKMKAHFKKLNDLKLDWQHNIWTNNPSLFPDDVKQIQGVYVRSIDDFKGHELYPYLVKTIEKGNKAYFSEASDLTRFMAVQKFGGIYTDMDCEIYNPTELLTLMKRFDFIGGRELEEKLSFYGSAFIAAKPNHPVLNEMIRITLRNHAMNEETPDYIKYPCNFYDAIYFNAPPLVTLAYFNKNNIDGNKDVILPSWMVLNYGFSRFKNKYCSHNKISKEKFIEDENNLPELIKKFTSNIKDVDDDQDNIYYSLKDRNKFKIISADMGCGGWSNIKTSRYYYWNFK
jgi:mannosyltransferase OCH1-like enzyme